MLLELNTDSVAYTYFNTYRQVIKEKTTSSNLGVLLK